MKLLAPARLALRQRAVPVLARGYVDPWTGPHATESEQDVRADQDRNVMGKPSSVLQEETVEELHARTEEADYHEALKNELPKTGKTDGAGQKNAK